MEKKKISRAIILFFISLLLLNCSVKEQKEWKPNTDWGHWILGHKSDLEFLKKNNMTVTFGSGAPNVDEVTRAEFDSQIEEAKIFNKSYHDRIHDYVLYVIPIRIGVVPHRMTFNPNKEES